MESSRSGARRTSRRAVPTAATAGAAATWCWSSTRSLRDLSGFRRGAHFKAKRGGHGQGANRHGATPDALEVRVPPGTVVEDPESDDRWDLAEPGRARGRGPRRQRRARQQAVRDRHAPEPALRRARAARRGADARPAPQADADAGLVGLPERRQVVAARPAHARAAQGRRLPVHDARAGARHARAGRPPARDRRHPRADRGRERGCRARARVPGPRRALPAAGARAGPGAARRLGPRGQLRHRRGRAARARPRARPVCRALLACRRPIWCPPDEAERRRSSSWRAAAGRAR